MNKIKRRMSNLLHIPRKHNRIELHSTSITPTGDMDISWGLNQKLGLQIQHEQKVCHRLGEDHGYVVPAIDMNTKMKYWIKVLPQKQIKELFETMQKNANTTCTVVPKVFGLGYFQETQQSCITIQDYGIDLKNCSHLTKTEIQLKINFCKEQLKEYEIEFDEDDLDPSHILYSKHFAHNKEGVTIINLVNTSNKTIDCDKVVLKD